MAIPGFFSPQNLVTFAHYFHKNPLHLVAKGFFLLPQKKKKRKKHLCFIAKKVI
jgi:hypothetical protein